MYVWRSTRQEALAEVVLMSAISHTFPSRVRSNSGQITWLKRHPGPKRDASSVAVCGDENENSVVEGPSKVAAGSSQRSSRHIEQLHRAKSFPCLSSPHPRRQAQRSHWGFKPSSQSVTPGWANPWPSQKRPRQPKTPSSTVHSYLSHTHTLDARPHICTRY